MMSRYIVRKGNLQDQVMLRFLQQRGLVQREVDESDRLVVWHRPLSLSELDELDALTSSPCPTCTTPNARLIAAAPEMADLLRRLDDAENRWASGSFIGAVSELAVEARALLTRIAGAQNAHRRR